jgi:hypothetical protein
VLSEQNGLAYQAARVSITLVPGPRVAVKVDNDRMATLKLFVEPNTGMEKNDAWFKSGRLSQ